MYFGSDFRHLNLIKTEGGSKETFGEEQTSPKSHSCLPKLWCKLDIVNTHLPGARLPIWFTAYISPLVSEKILDEKHQTGFRSMVHSYHIPDTISEKDVPVVTTREDNLPKYKLLSKITLDLHKIRFPSLGTLRETIWNFLCLSKLFLCDMLLF